MSSIAMRLSWVDLRRRKARSFFTIATIAAAVSSISLFALGPLMNRAMVARVERDHAFELHISTQDAVLSAGDIARLRALPNVRQMEARVVFQTRMIAGDHRENVVLYGVDDFANQQVDVVSISSGQPTAGAGLLTDPQNAGRGIYSGGAGSSVRVIDGAGLVRDLAITGVATTIAASQSAFGIEGSAVFYADGKTVREISGYRGVNSFEILLVNDDKQAVAATIEAVRQSLGAMQPPVLLSQYPLHRVRGTWGPGQDAFANIAAMFVVIAGLALISALFLIANTMNTIVGEQRKQIGIMKALGGRRRQIGMVYVRTALVLGVIGAVAGVLLGIALSNLVVRYVGDQLFSVTPGYGVDWPVMGISASIGIGASVLAAIPALIRATRVPVVSALQDAGVTSTYGASRIDRLLQRSGFLPRTILIGFRSIGRQKGRSATTTIQIGLAVANLLGVLGLGATVVQLTNAAWDANTFDFYASAAPGENRLDAHAEELARSVEGVTAVEPMAGTSAEFRGESLPVWGLTGDSTMFHRDAMEGRWFTAADEAAGRRVIVMSRYIAESKGIHPGDSITLQLPTGPADFEVIAIDRNQAFNGLLVFVPLATLQQLLGQPGRANELWLASSSPDHAAIDATASRVENVLAQSGYPVGTAIRYVLRDRNAGQNQQIVNIILVVGLLVVAISMVGLVNTTTMNILERTREVGILRCIGARAKDVRLVFGSEGLSLAVSGWLAGIPLGYAFDAAMVKFVNGIFHVYLPLMFPPIYVLVAFVGTVVLALLTMILPLRRATGLRAGEALRYQ